MQNAARMTTDEGRPEKLIFPELKKLYTGSYV